MSYEFDFLKSLLITIVIESTVLLLLVKFVFKKLEIPVGLILLTGIVASLATLPYFWFILPIFIKTKLYYILLSELLAIIFESVIILGFLRTTFKQALTLSLICNAVSYVIGLIINHI